jgi:hypothetical protein
MNFSKIYLIFATFVIIMEVVDSGVSQIAEVGAIWD